jgi:predicted phage replisome organizer
MSEVKWIKITVDIFEDDKILMLESLPDSDSLILIWIKLLALAGKKNNSGVFMLGKNKPYTEEMLAMVIRRPVNTVKFALKSFLDLGMLEKDNDIYVIPNWSKHQSLDQLEERKVYMREYMKKYRQKQKMLTNSGDIMPEIEGENECKLYGKVNSKANVNSLDKIREEKKIERYKDKKIKEFSTGLSTNDFFTDLLIEKKYITEDDENQSSYNKLFEDIRVRGWTHNDIDLCVRYVVAHINRTRTPVLNRLAFLKTAINDGFRRLNAE